MWALAEVFHLLANPADLVGVLIGRFSAISLVAWGSAVAAGVVLAGSAGVASIDPGRPEVVASRQSVWPGRSFMALCLLLVADLAVSAPLVGNHQMILALGSLLLLMASGWLTLVRASEPARGHAMVLSGLRWLFLVSYGLIAFSKLNSDYLNPVVSCAVVFSDEMSKWFGFSISSSGVGSSVAIYGSLLTELSVPLLLVSKRLRSAGVLLGLAFHGALSLEPVGHVYDFTAVLIPFLLLFAPIDVHRRLAHAVAKLQARISAPATMAAVVLVLLLNLIAVGIGVAVWVLGFVLLLIYLAALSRLVVPTLLGSITGKPNAGERATGSQPRQPEAPMLIGVRLAPPVAVVVLLALVNGLSPYLQLKTATAFNMYSNLRVLEDSSNHLIVPVGPSLRSPELFEVATEDSDHPLSYYPDRHLALPRQNLVWFLEESAEVDDESISIRAVASPETQLSVDAFLESSARGRRSATTLSEVLWPFGLWRAVDLDGPAQCLRSWGPAY